MRLRLGAFSRYRPRVLTVVLLVIIAALIVLANLTYDRHDASAEAGSPGVFTLSCGWPLTWHRRVVRLTPTLVGSGVLGWQWSANRLAANVAIWLIILAASAAACEWLLRRYRPRPRWSLRTMLAAVGLGAALCGWFASARNRANLQDELIATLNARRGSVCVERFGPKWLDLVGADRYRRWIVAADVPTRWGDGEEGDAEVLQLIERLRRLPHLRFLNLGVKRLDVKTVETLSRLKQVRTLCISVNDMSGGTPDGLAALAKMRQLRAFSFDGTVEDDTEAAHACLAPIGNMTQLEHLRLGSMQIASESLHCLGELTHLKSLSLEDCYPSFSDELPLLRQLPELPHLEALDLTQSIIVDADLPYLINAPNLKSLGLQYTDVTRAGLVGFGSLKSLEELAIGDELVSVETLDSLLAVKRLNALHLSGSRFFATVYRGDTLDASEQECGRVLDALRRSEPGIVIDDVSLQRGWPGTEIASGENASLERDVSWPTGKGIVWFAPQSAVSFDIKDLNW